MVAALTLSLFLTACAGNDVNPFAQVTSTPGVTASPSSYSTLSQPKTTGSALLPAVETTSTWGIVKENTPFKEIPDSTGRVIDQGGPEGIVAWEKKTSDNLWYMRAGGGWIHLNSTVGIYANRNDANIAFWTRHPEKKPV